eukprot:1503497-Amphidinium_carterae.1
MEHFAFDFILPVRGTTGGPKRHPGRVESVTLAHSHTVRDCTSEASWQHKPSSAFKDYLRDWLTITPANTCLWPQISPLALSRVMHPQMECFRL